MDVINGQFIKVFIIINELPVELELNTYWSYEEKLVVTLPDQDLEHDVQYPIRIHYYDQAKAVQNRDF